MNLFSTLSYPFWELKAFKIVGVLLIALIFVTGALLFFKPAIQLNIDLSSTKTIELTPQGRSKIGELVGLKNITASEAIRQRGGGQSQVNQLQTGYGELLVGELANMAAAGNQAAEKAIKIIKQASKKAEKYGGK